MYLYALVVNLQEDYHYNIDYLIDIKKTEDEAKQLMKENKRHYVGDEMKIIPFRVNKKDEVFVIKDVFEEAGHYMQNFLHLTTSEKRAKGWVENYRNTVSKFDDLEIQKYKL